MFNLSILILTHNRPKLFKRCVNSIKDTFDDLSKIQIIVNNDSNDIIPQNWYEFYTYQNENLSKIYEFCFRKANGKYIYFLEDDDYLLKSFKDVFEIVLKENINVAFCNFVHHSNILKGADLKTSKINFEQFKKTYNDEHFQLGRIIFKKELLDLNKFPKDNNIENDLKLFYSLKSREINTFNKCIYKQTCDGKDNLSFLCYNKDKRFMQEKR